MGPDRLTSLLRAGTTRLQAAQVPSPAADALALLARACGWPESEVRRRAALGEAAPEGSEAAYGLLLDQRADRLPLQHLTGSAAFRGLELAVGPGVFVPRPETEMLVDLVLDGLAEAAVVVDLCTGSGAIALAIKQERPDLSVHAVEVDPLAHAWAVRNQERLALAVDLRIGPAQSAFEELRGQVEVVVSNPPYIPDGMVPVDPEVRDHDPAVALYGGSADGLRIPVEVAARAQALLRTGGLLVMEHADEQGESLPQALARTGWADVTDHRDLTGRPRAVTARRT